MCKILAEKIIDLHSKEKISRNHLCLYKGVFSVKRLPFAQQCGRTFGGIAVGKAASEVLHFFAHTQIFERFFLQGGINTAIIVDLRTIRIAYMPGTKVGYNQSATECRGRQKIAQCCVWSARRGRSYGEFGIIQKSIKMTFLFASVIFFV